MNQKQRRQKLKRAQHHRQQGRLANADRAIDAFLAIPVPEPVAVIAPEPVVVPEPVIHTPQATPAARVEVYVPPSKKTAAGLFQRMLVKCALVLKLCAAFLFSKRTP